MTKKFSEDGLELSGGERQKIAIARAIFRNAQLIVLDEPTASIDAESENEIINCFKNMYHNKMLLWVSHRLSNAVDMDKIILLEEGRIYAIGNHKELYKKNEKYTYMFDLQAEKYLLKER